MSTHKMHFSAEIRKYQHFLLEKKVPYLELCASLHNKLLHVFFIFLDL